MRSRPSILLLVILFSGASFLWAPARAVPAPVPEPATAPEGMVMYNESHFELTALGGIWGVQLNGKVTRFRPVQGTGTVQLLSLGTGALVQRQIPTHGELVFGHGWIVVNPSSQDTF